MRTVDLKELEDKVSKACIDANKFLPDDLTEKIYEAERCETCPIAKAVFDDMKKNIAIAKEMNIPICQDTGMVIVFAKIGQDVHFVNGNFNESINKAVAKGYVEGKLRLSIVKDPFERVNTNDNTPAVIYTEIVPGDNVELIIAPKGFGSENKSRVKMFNPTATPDEVIDFIVETVSLAGSNPCPPMVVGVGIGGSFDYSAVLSKKALCRPVSERNKSDFYKKMEEKALKKINELNIGTQGFGGDTTAFAVAIEQAPTHIAGLPVSVNIGCHVTRHISVSL